MEDDIGLYAEVVDTQPDYSVLRINVFSKQIEATYTDDDHPGTVAQAADEWNAMFAEEWDNLRGSAGSVMERFIDLLGEDGVPPDTIQRAIDRMLEEIRE